MQEQRKKDAGRYRMTVQKAAAIILKEKGRPMTPAEIAREIEDRNMVESKANPKWLSFQQTLERNIRMNHGNNPRLSFSTDDLREYKEEYKQEGIVRYVSLPEWIRSESDHEPQQPVQAPAPSRPVKQVQTEAAPAGGDDELERRLRLYAMLFTGGDRDAAVQELLAFALNAKKDEILERVNKMI